MQNVVLVVHLILAIVLIVVVLLQRSEGGGLGMGGGGGVMTGRQAATAMTKVTWFFAVAFLTTSVALTILSAQQGASGSVVDLLPPTADGTAPAVPSGESLLPPSTGDQPLLPPRGE
ncbi:preprotein translocase subunit SecG [Jannaschia sp. LMIT008]|uniref:preprotein translocase subunit SecG n=1 Tax=Jannaschia maritima TaxID=3032585 RepID=UPI002810A377|nr:preprotein translocase subunit SecG [Jannaschia sp. LMIT008]